MSLSLEAEKVLAPNELPSRFERKSAASVFTFLLGPFGQALTGVAPFLAINGLRNSPFARLGSRSVCGLLNRGRWLALSPDCRTVARNPFAPFCHAPDRLPHVPSFLSHARFRIGGNALLAGEAIV